ncbi:MAG: hypothetical protein GY930_04800 [bacterium]|nr:hypothetical protein [bacterium]
MISLNVSTIAASALLLAFSPANETLEFTPKADTSVVRTLHLERNSEVETATIFIMEQEINAGGGMTSSLVRDVKLVDVIGKVEDGRVMDFVRTYETIEDTRVTEGVGEDVQVADDSNETSDLEGQAISFKWDADEEEYMSAYVGDEPGEDEWLEGLTASLDLVNWLPSDEVGEGDTWEIALDELGPIIWYGGFLFPVEGPDGEGKPEGAISISVPNLSETHVLEGAEGEIKITLVRVDEEDGQRIAVATFKLSGSVE